MAAKIKKGDTVIVLTGKDKGKTGEVLSVNPKEEKVIVAGINMAKKYDGSEVYYEFDLVDGEVKNLSLHIDVKYYGDTRYEADYIYYDGVNPSAPPLKP